MTTEIDTLPADAALDRLTKLQKGLGDLAEVYAEAVLSKDWEALGLTVAQWQAQVFEGTQLSLETRRKVSGMLSEAGRTVREIAAATGTSKSTVSADLSRTGTDPFEQVKPSRGVTREPKASPKTPAERQAARRSRQRQEKAPGQGAGNPAPEPEQPQVGEPQPGQGAGNPASEPDALRLAAEARADQLEAKVAELKAENRVLREDQAEVQQRLQGKIGDLEYRLDRMTQERDFFRDQMRQEQAENGTLREQLEAAPQCACASEPVTEIMTTAPLPDSVPEPERSAWTPPGDFEDYLRMGEPLPESLADSSSPEAITGPCTRCGEEGTPVLVKGEDTGRFACDPCFALASVTRPGSVSRPEPDDPGALV